AIATRNRKRKAGVKTDNTADLPVTDNPVDNGIQVLAKRSITSNGQFVDHVSCTDMGDIIEAWTPFGRSIINVLPVRRLAAGLSTCAVVANCIGHAFRPGVGNRELQAITHALLQYRLQSMIRLVSIGS